MQDYESKIGNIAQLLDYTAALAAATTNCVAYKAHVLITSNDIRCARIYK
jgi:hypothetical protein